MRETAAAKIDQRFGDIDGSDSDDLNIAKVVQRELRNADGYIAG